MNGIALVALLFGCKGTMFLSEIQIFFAKKTKKIEYCSLSPYLLVILQPNYIING